MKAPHLNDTWFLLCLLTVSQHTQRIFVLQLPLSKCPMFRLKSSYLWMTSVTTTGLHIWSPAKLYTCVFILVLSACLSVCILSVCMYGCQVITFESRDIGSLYLHMRYISMVYGLSSYMKVIWSRSSQEPKRSKIPIPQRKTSIGITPILSNIELWCLRAPWVFGYGRSNGVTAVVVTYRNRTCITQWMHLWVVPP